MQRGSWKAVERRIAGYFDTHRTPLSGGNSRHTQSDTLHSELYIEIKARKKIPALKLFKETLLKSKKENKTPAIVLVEQGTQTPILICSLKDIKTIASYVKDNDYKLEDDTVMEDKNANK